ncbi:MAG: hypothetical protein QOJ00_123 [Actinomycetota bacterium]
MENTKVWASVAAERIALSDVLLKSDDAAWDAPSLCGGWRVREVVAHLVVLAEAKSRFAFLARGMLVDPRPNRSIDKMARRTAMDATPEELCARLRSACDGRFVVPGMPNVVALGEVLVHRADISEAAGLPVHPADDTLRAALEAELKLWFAFGVSPKARKNRYVATDGGWSVGPRGGSVIEARARNYFELLPDVEARCEGSLRPEARKSPARRRGLFNTSTAYAV